MGEQAAEPAGKAAGDTSDMSFMFVPQTLSKKARSHAMKEHWKQRRRDKRDKESAGHAESTSSKVRRMLFPKHGSHESTNSTTSTISSTQRSQHSFSQSSGSNHVTPTEPQPTPAAADWPTPVLPGIPEQALRGMSQVMACGRLDPFDAFPIKLSPEHHKLIHHCKYTHIPVDMFRRPIRQADNRNRG